jgi:hypothetical protein
VNVFQALLIKKINGVILLKWHKRVYIYSVCETEITRISWYSSRGFVAESEIFTILLVNIDDQQYPVKKIQIYQKIHSIHSTNFLQLYILFNFLHFFYIHYNISIYFSIFSMPKNNMHITHSLTLTDLILITHNLLRLSHTGTYIWSSYITTPIYIYIIYITKHTHTHTHTHIYIYIYINTIVTNKLCIFFTYFKGLFYSSPWVLHEELADVLST